jgi:transcriptional regulator with XRE-family HTH domain
MGHDEDIQIAGTMSDYLVDRLRDEEYGQEYAAAYLKADFLTSVANSLFTLRREAGLTQAQVAERLHTKQSAIARLEADFDGAMSLRRLVDFSLACGYVPHHVTFAPLETANAFTREQPQTSFTIENHLDWDKANFQMKLDPVGLDSQTSFSVSTSATTLQGVSPNLGYAETQSQVLLPNKRANRPGEVRDLYVAASQAILPNEREAA